MRIKETKLHDPGPPTCHAGAIAFHEGSRFLACFAGTAEGVADNEIYVKIDDGEWWNPFPKRRVACWNPVFANVGDDLLLFFKTGDFCDRWQTWLSVWLPFDQEWSPPRALPAGLNGPVKGPPLVEGDRMICGSSVETMDSWTCCLEDYHWDATPLEGGVLRPQRRTMPIVQGLELGAERVEIKGVIQPALFRDHAGKPRFMARSDAGVVATGISVGFDKRATTSPLRTPDGKEVPGANSGLAVVERGDRKWMIWNPTRLARTLLVIKEFKWDSNGFDFVGGRKTLEDGAKESEVMPSIITSTKRLNGEPPGPDSVVLAYPRSHSSRKIPFHLRWSNERSYPYAVFDPDGGLRVVFTVCRAFIKEMVVDVD